MDFTVFFRGLTKVVIGVITMSVRDIFKIDLLSVIGFYVFVGLIFILGILYMRNKQESTNKKKLSRPNKCAKNRVSE